MKKFFLFAAAVVAAMAVNAQVWDVNANPANTKALFDALKPVVTKANVAEKTSTDDKQYIEVTNSEASVEASVEFDHFPMAISYNNSAADKKFFRIYPNYLQVDAKGVKITINCKAGDEISFYSRKYTKSLIFFVTGADKSSIEFKANAEDQRVTVKATATEVVFDTKIAKDDTEHAEYAQSYQFTKFEIVSSQAIEDVNAEVKAVKTFENGQLVIIKNGVRYNALGAQL